MTTKVNRTLLEARSFDIKTLNGDELHCLDTQSHAEYLVIDLSPFQGRLPGFNETLKVAMNAAVNAVLAALPQGEPAAASTPQNSASQAEKQARAQRNTQRREQLNARILSEDRWLTSRELSEKANFQSNNPSAGPNRWKAEGRIFALQLNGKDKYPEYALDEGFRPIPVVKQIISLFGDSKTPWGLAIWFASANSWLGGRKPKEVLATMPKQVMAAAEAEMEGGSHG